MRLLVLISFFTSLSLAVGCGESGPGRYDVSGTITYQGEPIPAGAIQFTPDSSQGNEGAAGFATIKDGKFDTAVNGEGVVGGAYIVSVEAYDGNPQGDRLAGSPLFYGYETTLDLPEESTTIEIEVPAQEAVNSQRNQREERYGTDAA